ncbi:hypothetical protein N8E89_22350 (plasmid) [Phyllobacterium sp. A18/5-2]|uniref:hypothetical protein n=1 Tax=Phyllobacterium sp. A18/5-2 TaxID=2978392 RepID=UPI0021C7A9FA|nr:hypothetical protein [Phyllobacterium sp. A18/5-2]UXN67228.1 hypothetical protein N8E89_22350 [Phyllobacterium sp. A18/5-2]
MGIAIESAVYRLMSAPKEEIIARPFRKPVIVIMGVLWVFGLLPVLIKMFGFDFLPSIEWTSKTNLAGVAAGLVSGAFLLWLVLKGIHAVPYGELKKVCSVLAAPFMGYVLGKHVVVIAYPMMLAMIAGHQVGHTFTVVHADRYGTRQCHFPLIFQGLPFLFDRVCGVPNDFRQSLTPGKRVVVIGRGTSLGVFAESLDRID